MTSRQVRRPEGDRPDGPRPITPRELQEMLQVEREGVSFLVYRDAEGVQRFLRLTRAELGIGRNPAADLCITWDGEVSGLHAQLEQTAGEHTLVDDGLSRNGSFVNGERVRGRRRLQDGDMLRFGRTVMLFRSPLAGATQPTLPATELLIAASLSQQQRRVLIALCRPFRDDDAFATPPTNQAIADELVLSVDAVKVHLRALYDKFGVAGLPQNTKRLTLVRRALQSGVIANRDL
jgi:pSer/pThr/pTyr-binding forkhead associated (FHA) protein